MNYIVQITSLLVTISSASGHFGYKECEQQNWLEKHKSCAGKHQSPIAILSQKTTFLPLPALEMVGYHNCLPEPLVLKNSGHSVVIKSADKFDKTIVPHIFGAGFSESQKYEVDHLHFHWGRRNSRGSEHTFNGIRYPMEMHIVHRNAIYKNISHALNFKDGLAVLGIFFQLQEEDNVSLKPIFNKLPHVESFNKEVELHTSVALSQLMPQNTEVFYTYKGSLTTPPCSEVVTWIIFPNPVPISFQQMNKLRKLSGTGGRLVDNYRKLQDIGNRKVYARKWKPTMVNCTTTLLSTLSNVTDLSWFE